jgi:hypothetical protein
MRLVRARELCRARPEDDVGFRPTAFSDPPTARRSLAAAGRRSGAVALGVLHREFYTEAGGDGEG